MKATINNKLLSRNLFFSAVFFITVFFSDWYGGVFYFNISFRFLKIILCILVPFLTSYFNFKNEKNLIFIGKSTAIIMSCFIVFFILFNTLGVEQFRFYQTVSLYHIVYALICLFTVFATATVIAEKNENTSYAEFYNDFFLGYLFVMIMLYYLFYYEYRTSSDDFIINLIPFHGEIKTVFKDFTSQTVMRTLGNIAYYSTVALTVSRFIKKHTALSGFLVAFLLCVITELVQGIFKTGDADIDDIILNGVGALIGALIYKFVIEKLRRKEICSE